MLLFLAMGLGQKILAQPFIHPGGLHTQADFDRMKAKVAANASPWVDSYNQLTTIWMANLNMPWHPVTQIVRGASPNNYARSQDDALAIYYHALRWRITGDTNYAEEAIVGMNLWSSTMTNGVGGNSNWALGAGICGYEFAVAGEALRGYTNWSQTSISNYCNFLKIFAGGNDSFLVNHNGTCDSHYWCNWDACNVASLMACAVFCDDTNMFNRAVAYVKQGKGNGNMTSAAWYVHTNGLAQWQESGRDQAHAMDGIAWMGVACQVAWNQGVDLYGYDDNLFLRGLEYSAKYNLWSDVPYASYLVCEGSSFAWGSWSLSAGARGFLPPTWDLFYNHYVNKRGLSAPWTAAAAAALRPDGFYNNANSPDFVGFTTLTCLLDPIPAGAVTGSLAANVSGTNVILTWWGSDYATNYLVKRATISGGSYTTLGTVAASADRYFLDTSATNGGTYYYAVSALDKFGESPNSPEKSVTILNQLVAYYKFNETNFATAADSSGFGRSQAIFMNGATNVSGKFGNAVNLNGSSQYVALPNGLLTGLNDFTIATWVNLNSVTAWTRIFDFGADTDRYMFLTPSAGSTVRFAITKFTGASEQQINGTSALGAGAWHHVAVTLKGSEGSGVGVLYVDGVVVGTNSTMSYTPDMIGRLVNATNNFIGKSAFAGDPYLNGKVDDFRIYNGALSAAQIAALYALTPVAAAAPTNVNATAASANLINLNWSPAGGATNYLVQRSTVNGGPYTLVASGVTATNYADVGLIGGTTYYYVIASVNSGGASTNSLQASTATLTAPPVPSSLTATGLYGGQIALSWGASAGATSYNIKRAMLSGGPYVTVATGVPTTAYTNSGLVFNATYYYVVSAVNANGESLNSNETNSIVPVPSLVWKGNVNTNWDIASTTNWLFGGLPSTYFVDGAAVTFNDTATTSSVNLSAGVAPYSVTISNSSLSYTVGSANGSGISGSAALSKWGTGAATLTGTNTFTGDITLNGGGTLAISGLLGGGNYSGNIINYNGTFNYNGSAAQILSGIISGSGFLLQSGTGVLTISGSDDYTGATTVRQGTLNLTGLPKSSSSVYGIYVVDNNAASTTNAVLNISTSVTTYELWLGDRAGSGQVGAAYQTAGDVVLTHGAGVNDFRIGSVASGRGYYKLSSGTLTVNEVGVGALNNDTIGIFDITGGAFTDSGWITIARGGATSSGLLNITGGSASAARVDMNWSSTVGALSVINVGGGNSAASLSVASSATLGVNLGGSGTTAGTYSIVNLRTNGTLNTGIVRAWQPAPTSVLNFDGGTLQANTSTGNFLTDGNIDGVFVYPNGGTIDNAGKAVTVDRPLSAPTGTGVSSITGPSIQGSGYVAPLFVTITGGTFTAPATAYAVMADDGTGKGTFKVSGIVVSSRGIYSVAPTTVTLTGGGASVAASGLTINTAANASGGMTFTGSGTTILSGVNTYAGATVIASGTVKQGGPLLYLSFDNTNGTTVVNGGGGGAVMNGTLTGTNVSIVSGGHSGKALMVSNGPVSTGYVQINSAVIPFNGQAGNNWTVAMWLKTTSAGGVYLYQGDGGWASGNTEFYLENGTQADGAGTHAGGVRWGQSFVSGTTNLNDGGWHFVVMTVTNGTKTLYCDGAVDPVLSGASSWTGFGTGSQLWIGGAPTGADSQIGFNGLIDDVSIFGRALNQSEVTNLMNGATVASPALPAGNDLTVASGATLVLNGSAQTVGTLAGGNSGAIQLGAGSTPTALTFGKSASSTFAASITGSGSVTKVGTGTVTLSGVNAYSGATTISNGTVKFGQSDNSTYIASLGPMLWFNFDQGVDVVDGIVTNLGLGGTAMNGTFNGGGAVVTGGGRYGNTLSLDGNSDVVINSAVTPLDCNTNGASWTYALWIKTTTAGAVYGYQGDGTWNSGATTFYLNSNGTASGTKAGGVRWGDAWLTGTATLNNNAWHFVAITVNAGVKTIYVDGNVDAQTGTTGWTQAAMTTANQFWIGQSPDDGDGGVGFNGLIDEVYMFNRALSQSEITNIMGNQLVDSILSFTGQLPATSPVSLASAATLDLAGTSQTIASLADIGGSGGLVTNSGVSATLTLNAATTNIFTGLVRGNLALVKNGSGTQSLNGANTYTGNTTVNAGTLAFAQATLPTNAIVTVTNGAVLTLNFTITNQVAGIVLNGTNKSPGVYNAANSALYIAGTGSLVIANPVATNPTNVSFSIGGGNLMLAWPADHAGWRVQVQTNSLNAGLGTNWVNLPNSNLTNQFSAPIVSTNGSVFFRLVYP